MMCLSATGCYHLIEDSNLFSMKVCFMRKPIAAQFYSEPNEAFVEAEIINYLEGHGFKTCWHQRDFMPGTNIAENIAEAIEHSRRMTFVLSR